MAPGSPEAVRLVPSMGSMATSTSGSRPLPIDSPKYSIGASSFSPSPITTVLSRRGPPGRSLVDSSSCGRGPCGGLGLMVRRDEAEPASRMPGRGAGTAGLMGSGFGVGSCSGLGARLTLGGACVAGLGAVRAGPVTALRPWGGVRFAALAASRLGARAGGFWPRACDGFLDCPLEELTPEFSDSPDWAWRGPQRYDRRLRRHVGHALARCVGNAFGVNSDHSVVNAAFLDDQGAYCGVSLQPAGARDLQPVAGDDVPSDETGDRDPGAPDVRLHLRLGTDQQVAVALDLPAEDAQDLARPLQRQVAGHRVLARKHRLLGLENKRIRTAVGGDRTSRIHRHVSHLESALAALLPSFGRRPPTAA